ncbi:MAG TPA: alcohol dehydrogenase catalytic domain-containing protein [Actinomycetota bacterium]|nr:alcohol dehydrogenase catalytic domain-containing protein [Actinomycetota bacterium]
MRAVVYADVGQVRVDDVPDPTLERDDDALIGVTRAAICGSDMHFFHGKAPLYPGEPMGHEAVGVVEDVGPRVTRFRPGDRVVASFTVACGACWFCRNGRSALCDEAAIFGTGLFGGELPGTQAERLRVPHADVNLLAIPDEVDDERAVFVADIATTARYVAGLAAPTADETVAVVGAGPVGLLVAQALVRTGAAVVALDREDARLAAAEGWGAAPVHVDRRNPQMALASVTGDRGADVAIDAVGSPSAFATAVDVTRRGGRVVVAGMYAGETIDLQLGTYWIRGLDLRFAGVCPIHAHWDATMDDVATGRLDPTVLVSHRLALDEAQRGYELFDRREATKVILTP